MNALRLLFCCLFLGLGSASRAQVLPVGDVWEEYARLLQLHGEVPLASSFSVRPSAMAQLYGEAAAREAHPWDRVLRGYGAPGVRQRWAYGVFSPETEAYWNSARPVGGNDGAVWQGRGATVALSAGVFGTYRIREGLVVTGALRPLVIYTQNRDFELSPLPPHEERSPYAYPVRNDIDLPQRFGPDPYTTLDLGESYVRLDYRGLALGLSNETMWWGPAVRNAIIMSNNAPGFRHAFLGTSRPVDVWLGHLEARWVWGHLWESDFFDTKERNDRRFLTGIAAVLSPKRIRGLYLGAAHTLMLHASIRKPLLFRDYLGVINLPLVPGRNLRHAGTDDKLVSLFFRWVLPESGFEVYAEWARGDHTASRRDLLIQPEHARGYTLGLQKSFVWTPRLRMRLSGELTSLEAAMEVGFRSLERDLRSYFYTHEGIKQGYTQRGQVMGAGIGPGASSQSLGLDLFAPWGLVGLVGRRTVYDNDLYYGLNEYPNFWLHEVELEGGFRGLLFVQGFELEGGVSFARLLNRGYIFKNDLSNVNVRFAIRRALMGYR